MPCSTRLVSAAFVAILLCATASGVPGLAQSFTQGAATPVAEGDEAQLLAMLQRIDALAARIEELEKADDKPQKAPFVVVDDAGAPIFTVEATGDGPTVKLEGQGGGVILRTGQRAGLNAYVGDNKAFIVAQPGATQMGLSSNGRFLLAGNDGDSMGVSVSASGMETGMRVDGSGPSVWAQSANRVASVGAVAIRLVFLPEWEARALPP